VKTIHQTQYRRLIGELRLARTGSGLTQADAGILIGHSRQWLSKVETCEIRLDVLQFVRLCHAYSLKAHDLVRGLEEGAP
jgi:DNA-binding XRE family transcriptional regulator